jgi:hypothetical protein
VSGLDEEFGIASGLDSEFAGRAARIKRIDIKEFRERGYLQEVNRCFFHPLGLALEVAVAPDGTETLGGVWDYRDDPEGVRYADDVIDKDKAAAVAVEWADHAVTRLATLGFTIQPSGAE